MKKIKLLAVLLALFLSFKALADMSWEEIHREGKNQVKRNFYLKANLMRVDLEKPGLSYFYNLDNHSLAALNRDENKFYFLDWRNLTGKTSQMNAKKQKLLGEPASGPGEGNQNPVFADPTYFYYDPFGVEPMFYCPGPGFESKALDKARKISRIMTREFSITCAGRVFARAWVNPRPEPTGEWQSYLDGLRWMDIDRHKFYSALPAIPVLIQSEKAADASYEIKDISRDVIPLDKFILPENAKPIPVPQTRD